MEDGGLDKEGALSEFVSVTNAEIGVAQSLLEACEYEMDKAVDLYFSMHGGGGIGGMVEESGTAPTVGAGEPSSMEVEDAGMEEANPEGGREDLQAVQLVGEAVEIDRSGGSAAEGIEDREPLVSPYNFFGILGQEGLAIRFMKEKDARTDTCSHMSRSTDSPVVNVEELDDPETHLRRRPRMRISEATARLGRLSRQQNELLDLQDALENGGPARARARLRTLTPDEDMPDNGHEGGTSVGGSGAPFNEMLKAPQELLYYGTFEDAKKFALAQSRYLVVNIQSRNDLASIDQNRDLWSHDYVKDLIKKSFVFFQVFGDIGEGRKLETFYRLTQKPAILIVDPLTGQVMKTLKIKVTPNDFLEDVIDYLEYKGSFKPPSANRPQTGSTAGSSLNTVDIGEDDQLALAIAHSMEDQQKNFHAPVNEEPIEIDTMETAENKISPEQLMQTAEETLPPEEPDGCMIAVRLPSGKRITRKFPKDSPTSVLYTLVRANVEDAAVGRRFALKHAFPGATPIPDNDSELCGAHASSMLNVVYTQ